MNLLAIDTSTPFAVVVVSREDGSLVVASIDSGHKHGRQLVPAIRKVLQEAGLRVSDLAGVAVGLGPGSYTGLRIGLTAAKTLAYAAGIPLVGLNSLEIIAQNAPADAHRISVVADAQRDELYVANFARVFAGSSLEAVGPTTIEPVTQWMASLLPETVCLGPAFDRSLMVIPEGVLRANDHPTPEHLMELAHRVWQTGKRDDPWFLEPVYLRRSAAEDLWDARPTSTRSASDGR